MATTVDRALAPVISVSGRLAVAARILREASVNEPAQEARVLMAHVLHCSTGDVDKITTLSLVDLYRLRHALYRRVVKREPTAYITEQCVFRGLPFHVDRRVLWPRPETEALVEAALGLPNGAQVVDVGTGSGAVALALKAERRDLVVCGTDTSSEALEVANENREALGLSVTLQQCNLIDNLPSGFRPEAVVGDLPYLPTRESTTFEREMTEYEPSVALWGGTDGFALIDQLLAQVYDVETIRFVALECRADQCDELSEKLRKWGFGRIGRVRDQKGVFRVVTGERA